MPELPEVEVTRQGLLAHLAGRRVKGITWSGRRLRRPMPRKLLRQQIDGERIRTVDRRAKYLLFRMENESVLVIHLGMTGRIGMFPSSSQVQRHDHLRLLLDNGLEMRFNDCRRFGSVDVWPTEEAVARERAFTSSQGLEPLGNAFTAGRLHELARGRRLPVKSFLMDGRLIAGVGNIYANETLFAARLSPFLPANRLDLRQWEIIRDRCRHILRAAIRAGGSSISDFLNAGSQPGYFQLQLAVYGRDGHPCPCCATTILRTRLGGRATFFCPHCQNSDDPSTILSSTVVPAE